MFAVPQTVTKIVKSSDRRRTIRVICDSSTPSKVYVALDPDTLSISSTGGCCVFYSYPLDIDLPAGVDLYAIANTSGQNIAVYEVNDKGAVQFNVTQGINKEGARGLK